VSRRTVFGLVVGLTLGSVAAAAAPAAPVRVSNGRIAFVERGRIYTIRPDGSGIRKLSSGDYRDLAASPDGRSLAAADDLDLYVVRADGKRRRLLLRGGGGRGITPSWSPRGDEIAADLVGTIDLVRVRDGQLHPLVSGSFPSWTPDGSAVVYEIQGYRLPGRRVYDSVWEIGRDGNGKHRLASRAAMPAVSPDGKHIAFVGESRYGDLGVMDAHGGHRRTLARGDARRKIAFEHPSWSPDGRFLLAGRVVGGRHGETELYVVPAGGGRGRIIHRQKDVLAAAWQPRRR
jgi:Tol biopolymer transport system component